MSGCNLKIYTLCWIDQSSALAQLLMVCTREEKEAKLYGEQSFANKPRFKRKSEANNER